MDLETSMESMDFVGNSDLKVLQSQIDNLISK